MTERRKQHTFAMSVHSRRFWLVAGIILLLALGIGWRLATRAVSTAAPIPVATSSSVTTVAAWPVYQVKGVSEIPAGPAEQLQLVYFHRTQRCEGCIAGERLARQTLDTFFTSQMTSGLITFTSLDVQAPENAAIAQKFGASGSSLYFSVRKGGAEYLFPEDEIWFVLNNETQFLVVLRAEILTALGAG